MTIQIGDVVTLDKAIAVIDQLNAADKAKLIEKIGASAIDNLHAKAERKRLERFEAAISSSEYHTAFRTAIRSLDSLGLNLEKIAASGDVIELDAAMSKHGWDSDRRMQLKTALASIYAIR
jgi:hypothetical protein